MEAHPVPQNVTSFQFKLVGDMTLKQFLYLAAGIGFAYLLFVILSQSYPLIAWPLVILSVILGISFAFLPIESRPLDYWLSAFLKAIYSPTIGVWRKNGKTFKDDPLFSSRLIMYLAGTQPQPSSTAQPGLATTSQFVFPSTTILAQTKSQTPEGTSPLPTPEQLRKTVDLARQAQQLQMKIIQTERTLSQMKTVAQQPTPIPVDYSKQVNKILADLQNLVTQASEIKQQIQAVQKPKTEIAPAASEITSAPPLSREAVKVVIPAGHKQTQVALTTFPNVINGIVKDNQNNYMEGAVAVIYDKEGLPVRALKTNKLGQFTGSTPLPNGTYTLELEKDGFSFDVLQIELNGEVLPPLLITAK